MSRKQKPPDPDTTASSPSGALCAPWSPGSVGYAPLPPSDRPPVLGAYSAFSCFLFAIAAVGNLRAEALRVDADLARWYPPPLTHGRWEPWSP